MGGCCMNCDPFRCFRRKREPESEEELITCTSDDSTRDSDLTALSDSLESLLPQLPPIDLPSRIRLPGLSAPRTDRLQDTLFSEESSPSSLPDMVNYHDDSTGQPPRDIDVLGKFHSVASAATEGGAQALDSALSSAQARINPQIIDKAAGVNCDPLTEAMQAMAEEPSEQQGLEGSLENPTGSHTKKGIPEKGGFMGLVPDAAIEARTIASRITIPEPEAADEKNGSNVAFTVDIKPPSRPLPLNWRPSQVIDRVCRGMDIMMEVRIGINQILRDRPDYAAGLPYTIQQKKWLEVKALGTILSFTNRITEDGRFCHEKEPIRLLVTCFEILVQCASASLAAARKAAEECKSQEEDEAIRRQFQRWLLQTWADVWVLEEETAAYLNMPPAYKLRKSTA
ncbi:hypothetical protein MGYG_02403 [Nannizzia gypsea CBS 118893]|uniref:Uncharacterized protein n=1 Tax=Arthroderma gypseum (strain ATCC MYA-4604 / CBS 118893) TaxID=535722 RepID=E4URG9_ARTGP|nr:hypothetical protein MGYG_02403 [Nannizzia gypsea CBS 118893]EFQ99391.1 hypothetical protein MGYG_02403 [Nannizzia gypsea CBS 118893]